VYALRTHFVLFCCALGILAVCFAARMTAAEVTEETSPEKRSLRLLHDGQWMGRAICYSPYRAGQRPGGPGPSKGQLREDLQIIAKHWPLLRTYSSTEFAETMLEVIQEEKLAIHVMLGAWIEPETVTVDDKKQPDELARQVNQLQIENLVKLSNKFEEIVVAVILGNETQVEWSSHKVTRSRLIGYLRKVRSQTKVPITTADDFLFWAKSSSRPIVDEVDFIMTHIHPVWHAQEAEAAQAFVQEKYELVTQANPGSLVVIGETGWATQTNTHGREAEFVRGKMGEDEQKLACQQIVHWSETQRVATFLFEAFDEPWKGADPPDDIEKHWGLFREDRTPKKFMDTAK